MSSNPEFIIVGGGTSALLLASRLASTPSAPAILVLEAGPDYSAHSYRNPSQRYSLAFTNPEIDYGYSTVPQTGLGGRPLPYMRGKGLGGSSLINCMIYLSGSKEDYNYWAELVGDENWKWENTKRRFRELENFNREVAPENRAFANPKEEDHGNSGTVDAGLPAVWEAGTREILTQVTNNGVPANLDLNSGNPIGIGLAPVVAANGYRTTSASAHLADKPSNLSVWTETTVVRILFDGLRATGVELSDGRQVFASREVIISAGSFDTPKLLLLSGIGSSEELSKQGINTLVNLPGVGKGLSDHPGIFLTALMKPGFGERMAFETNASAFAAATQQWNKDGTGQMATESQSLVVMFNKIPALYESEEFKQLPPNVKEYLQRDAVPTYEGTFGGPKFPPGVVVPPGFEYLCVTTFGMNTQGLGTVGLASSNPSDAVVIDTKTITHPYDRIVLIESLIDTLKIFKGTKQYKDGFVSWLTGPKSDSREDIEGFLEEQAFPIWHAAGSVKMGKKEDESACVDHDFKIRGVEGLRVVDMSVAPVAINGHTQAVAYLIGAVAAEKIISEYKL